MPYQIINAIAYLNNQVKVGILSHDDTDLIHEFCEERKAIKHISEATALVTSKGLSKFAPSIAPFKQCTTQDIIKGINAVEKIWKQNTRRLRIYYLIQFCLWLVNEGALRPIEVREATWDQMWYSILAKRPANLGISGWSNTLLILQHGRQTIPLESLRAKPGYS